MRLKGLTTAIDYAYLNVIDINDPDNRFNHTIQERMPSWKFIWSKKSKILLFIVSWPILLSLRMQNL